MGVKHTAFPDGIGPTRIVSPEALESVLSHFDDRYVDAVDFSSDGIVRISALPKEITVAVTDANGPYDTRIVSRLRISDLEVSDAYIDEKMKFAVSNWKMGYLAPVKLEGLGTSGIYRVLEDYSYEVDYHAVRREPTGPTGISRVPVLCNLTAKRGFEFDRASIPRIFWAIISKDDLSNVPPLFHDLIYRYKGQVPSECVRPQTVFSKDEADALFWHLMQRTGVVSWRAYFAYKAVSHFGHSAWNQGG